MQLPQNVFSQESRIASLAASNIFAGLDEAVLKDIADQVLWFSIGAGEALINQGDQDESLFILVLGRLRVFYRRPDGKEIPLAEIERGETIGEMALITQEPRSATVRAMRQSYVAKLDKITFDRLESRYPALMRQFALLLIKRLNAARASGAGQRCSGNLALIPAGPDAPAADFAARLCQALSAHGSVFHFNETMFDKIWGKGAAECRRDDPRVLEFARWFGEEERKHKFAILECNHKAGNWSARCIGQADRAFLVGRAGADHGLSEIEASLLSGEKACQARRELVLVHPDGSRRPSGTQAWLEKREITRHHHVRLDREDDFARLARILSGKATGLVLGGGGARGFAHIGVVRAFTELGIPIDFVGGTSMGAILGGQVALGMSWKEMIEASRIGFVESNPFKDYTFPAIGLNTGRKMSRMLRTMYGDTRIEDMWVNYFCVSNNLSRAEMVAHTSGPVWRWVRASSAVPGVVAPILYGGELIIDGGVLNNLPVDVMQSHCEGKVVAVDVSPKIEMKTDMADSDALSGWGLLWKRINPLSKKPKLPTIAQVMSRTAMLASVHNSEAMQRRADLYLHPPMEEIDLFEWKALEKGAERGYQFGLERISRWHEAGKSI